MSADESLLSAAARILARHHDPDWRPSTPAELDAWGRGYDAAARDRHAQDASNQVGTPLDCEWPPVAIPGGGA
ncbi:hypothetical protein FHR83_007037 [Actinoplanes campanulatus]|uniref:Uncharacterized protein n=1 Tax=Actinoplanes campanulatus TaxID=113559 RepID=A0A7W5AN38_9ACTN|nr:hypothetical protein [Actinoplanes campanulatus]MBB3099331.1 hypothetical protein [Actinoplanes campanulatus]GGN40443.1 hypothetical protein GCM10010109_69540 [Actinoplanes campanulatus]GID40649.1 hypothetical protein Aca09nite_71550 [Actinoplanes campanulatus]